MVILPIKDILHEDVDKTAGHKLLCPAKSSLDLLISLVLDIVSPARP